VVSLESKHEVARQRAVGLLPERDEAEDLLGLLALAEVGIGVAEGASVDVLRKEGEHALLAAAAHRDEVPFDDRVIAIERNRVEVEVEGVAVEQLLLDDRPMIGGQELDDLAMADARGVLGEEAALGNDVEAGQQPQPLVGDLGHHVAAVLDRPQLERKH